MYFQKKSRQETKKNAGKPYFADAFLKKEAHKVAFHAGLRDFLKKHAKNVKKLQKRY